MSKTEKPIVLITGAAGNIGRSLAATLDDVYAVVGLDQEGSEADFPLIPVDLTKDDSVTQAIAQFREIHGSRIASVIHLAAFFDFSGEDNPLYEAVNVEGTRRLLQTLQDFDVEQFVYSSTILVHAPGRPGEPIDEEQPIAPGWAYPRSKAAAEEVVRTEHSRIPYVLLRLAGLYDERTSVPTLANQVARIHARDFQSYFYAGPTEVGQSMVHREDMLDALRRVVDRRKELPPECVILIGEPQAMGYDALQDELGYLIHGAENWPTLRLPKAAAVAGAWAQDKLEPVVPDALDQGERPFVKPFMVRMADDHYELDVARARKLLGWEPRHRLKDALPAMVSALKEDPVGWYKANGITPSPFIAEAADAGHHPEGIRQRYEERIRTEHRAWRWAHFLNIALGFWLITQPPMIGVEEPWLARTEGALGTALILFASLSLSWQLGWAVGLRGHRRAGDGGTLPLLDDQPGGLSVGHSCRCADLRPRDLHAARDRPIAARDANRPRDPVGVELQPILIDPAAADHPARARRPAGVALSRRLSARPCGRGVGTLLRRIGRRPEERH
jgi:nucleoside-diphosphate-sugar epimerase